MGSRSRKVCAGLNRQQKRFNVMTGTLALKHRRSGKSLKQSVSMIYLSGLIEAEATVSDP